MFLSYLFELSMFLILGGKMKRLIAFLTILILLLFFASCQNIINNPALFSPLHTSVTKSSDISDTVLLQPANVTDSDDSKPSPAPTSATTPTPSFTPTPVPSQPTAPTPCPSPTSTPISAPNPAPVGSPTLSSEQVPASVQLPDISIEKALNIIPVEYQQLKFFKLDNIIRYVGYKDQNPDFDYEKVILYVNIGLDLPFFTNINTITETNRIDVLVNKYNRLPDGFAPELEQLPALLCAPRMGNQYLRKDAKIAFERMHYDAKEMGLNITAYGTYRSIELQNSIWNRKVNSGRTIEDVDSLNSRGGHSEHNTGLAIDVIKNNYTVENTAEFKWYKDNAHLYGFIIRYPNDKEQITGYSYEPWHLRYLGPDLATEVYNSGLTFDEYYTKMIEK